MNPMSSDGPKLRNACENCHKRKIRCQIALNEAACQNCAASGTACLFAPRVKTGRPRLSRAATVSVPTPQATTEEETLPISRVESHTDVSTTTMSTPDESSQLSVSSQSGSDQTALQQPWLLDENHEFEELHRPISHSHHSSDLRLQSPNDDHSGASISSLSHHMDNYFQSQVSLHTSSSASASASPPSDLDAPPAPDAMGYGIDFNAALSLCAKLELHLQILQEATYQSVDSEGILGDVDLACQMVMQPMSDICLASKDASSALLIAALYKVFEICEAFIRRIFVGTTGQDAQSGEHLVILKRLDLVLLRAKIFLTRAGQHNAATKASRISLWIESVVKQQYQHWTW